MKMVQEEINEAALEFSRDVHKSSRIILTEDVFKAGVKFAQNKMYSEQEVKEWLNARDLYLYNYYTTYKDAGIPMDTVDNFFKESHEYLMQRKLFNK